MGRGSLRLALSYRALGRRDDAQRALERHAQYGPAWPALEDRVLAAISSLRDDAAANLAKGLKLAGAGDLAGAIAGARSGDRPRPVYAQAHANLISLYGQVKDWDRAEAHYRAVVASAPGLAMPTTITACCSACAAQWDRAGGSLPSARSPSTRSMRTRATTSARSWSAKDPAARLPRSTGRRSRAGPNSGSPGSTWAACSIARGNTEEAIGELEQADDGRATPRRPGICSRWPARTRGPATRPWRSSWATDARQLAVEHGQDDLAAAIDRQLATIK